MYVLDFGYDGQYLSDYGFIVCQFDTSSGVVVANAGSKISFEKASRNRGMKYSLTGTRYNECITTTFDICKNPDIYDSANRQISIDEHRALMRWLNRREFLKFQVLYEDGNNCETCYFNASFNIEKIIIAGKLYGLRLTMESDSPFAYGEEQTVTLDFEDVSVKKNLYNISDEIGSICPFVTIVCSKSGTLELRNESENCSTIIKGCLKGETITLDGDTQTISTTRTGHDICNDFDYTFFKIGNSIDDRNNLISVSIPCKVTIRYTPIIKGTP